MKAKLTFKLPEDRCEFRLASKAVDWALAVWDMDQWLRDRLKYSAEELGVAKVEEAEAVREKLHAILSERGLDLDDVE